MAKYAVKISVIEIEHGRGIFYNEMKSSWSNSVESDLVPEVICKKVLDNVKKEFDEAKKKFLSGS